MLDSREWPCKFDHSQQVFKFNNWWHLLYCAWAIQSIWSFFNFLCLLAQPRCAGLPRSAMKPQGGMKWFCKLRGLDEMEVLRIRTYWVAFWPQEALMKNLAVWLFEWSHCARMAATAGVTWPWGVSTGLAELFFDLITKHNFSSRNVSQPGVCVSPKNPWKFADFFCVWSSMGHCLYLLRVFVRHLACRYLLEIIGRAHNALLQDDLSSRPNLTFAGWRILKPFQVLH